MPKQAYRSNRRSYPLRRDRPPWPMSAKERLYEVRKRHHKTEIKSEYLKWLCTVVNFCEYCPEVGDDGFGCSLTATRDCPYGREARAYYKGLRADARRRRPTLKERLYEVRKRDSRRANEYRHARTCYRKRHYGKSANKGYASTYWKHLCRASVAVSLAPHCYSRAHRL